MAAKASTAKESRVTKARVTVYPRREILDPQGKAIAGALGRLGFDAVTDVRAGRSFDLTLRGLDAKGAKEAAEKMADKLLANTVVEDFSVEILEG